MKRLAVFLICVAFLAGCGSYYKVTDPASKNIYYTDSVEQLKSGAVKFKDAKTGGEITLQSSEVKEIDSKEFQEATKPAEKK
jgi:uncharacterized protein YceK